MPSKNHFGRPSKQIITDFLLFRWIDCDWERWAVHFTWQLWTCEVASFQLIRCWEFSARSVLPYTTTWQRSTRCSWKAEETVWPFHCPLAEEAAPYEAEHDLCYNQGGQKLGPCSGTVAFQWFCVLLRVSACSSPHSLLFFVLLCCSAFFLFLPNWNTHNVD